MVEHPDPLTIHHEHNQHQIIRQQDRTESACDDLCVAVFEDPV